MYFAIKARKTLQAVLEEVKIKNLFETPEDKEANTWTVIDGSVTGIKTLLNTITIVL